ncbi:hypothetical protein H5410_058346 [Solanum commersonii]|uniref:Uncharacterized protein n=1 Tax=Solanum commersonii TaxID=4109 RepID=A0A9J5WSV3_SOLCO|nr:hypothetical protein H5410_058346 [Solanum commersonii]
MIPCLKSERVKTTLALFQCFSEQQSLHSLSLKYSSSLFSFLFSVQNSDPGPVFAESFLLMGLETYMLAYDNGY